MGKLERTQHQEAQALRTQHSRASQEAARAIQEGRDMQQFRKETAQRTRQDLSGEFQRRVWERIREAKQRREDEKKRGKDRDPERER
jgi:O6-methylguanine-DNA--protein-cysteine methyltransferase